MFRWFVGRSTYSGMKPRALRRKFCDARSRRRADGVGCSAPIHVLTRRAPRGKLMHCGLAPAPAIRQLKRVN